MKTVDLFYIIAILAQCYGHPSPSISLPDPPPFLWKSSVITGNATFGTPLLLGVGSLSKLALIAVDVDQGFSYVNLINPNDGSIYWQKKTEFVESNSGWIAYGETAHGPAIFFGTDKQIVACDLSNGSILWTYKFPKQAVSAHTSYFEGLVIFTCENGAKSTVVTALDASTGELQWKTNDIAYTILWPTTSGVFVYCSYDASRPEGQRIGPVARDVNGSLIWAHYNETSTDLNNNPNLVVAQSNNFYMYTKPTPDNPLVTMIEATTGDEKWVLPIENGPVDDYDTYAWNSRFFRLTWYDPHTFRVQAWSESKKMLWQSFFPTDDPNWIILVGGGAVFAFGQVVNQIRAFDANDGSPLWILDIFQPQDGGVSEDGKLVFGDGHGVLYCLQI